MEIISKSSMGELIISDEVLSSIAVNAAKDVDGVSSFCNKPVDVVNTIKQGSLKVMSPVRVVQDGDALKVFVYINIEAGAKIQPVAEKVQKVVKESVQNMTGKYVSKVNVIIASVENEEPENSVEPCESEEWLLIRLKVYCLFSAVFFWRIYESQWNERTGFCSYLWKWVF